MPLSADNVIQEATGTTGSPTLPAGTTAGSTVVVVFSTTTGLTPPTGFVSDASPNTISLYSKSDVTAGETTWSFGASTPPWYAVELSNVDLVSPLDASVSANNIGLGTGVALSTGTTGLNAGLSTVAFAVWATASTASTVSWSAPTNGFAEVVDFGGGGTAGMMVARLFTDGATQTFSSSSTLSISSGTVSASAAIVVYRAADAPVVAPLALLLGFEWGTHGGITSAGQTGMMGAFIAAASGTFGVSQLIQAGSARNSSYGLRIVQSNAAATTSVGALNSRSGSFGFNVRVVSATGTVQVANLDNFYLVYDATATKFGVKLSAAGTPTWQPGTTALNTWVWIDGRIKENTTTHHADWRIETAADTYTDQTGLDLAGQSVTTLQNMVLGSTATTQTMTVDFDDVVTSKYYAAFPLGPHEVRLLTVDPAGTPTVSGTTTNFSVFTANGTLAAWNATNARNALDEVPPTVSAAADGVVQTAAAATDYMQFPMADYTLGPTEFVNGVRMLAPIWSGTGAGAGDLAIRGFDGTTETALATVSQLTPGSPTAISATLPLWRAAMWQHSNGWTQALLNALALRVGYSGDATPDMGVSALYLEVAIGQTRTRQLFGDFATVEEDPTRLGVMSITVTAPSGGDSTLYYEDNTVPSTVPVATETSVTQQIDSETAADANYIAFYPPPEGVPDA